MEPNSADPKGPRSADAQKTPGSAASKTPQGASGGQGSKSGAAPRSAAGSAGGTNGATASGPGKNQAHGAAAAPAGAGADATTGSGAGEQSASAGGTSRGIQPSSSPSRMAQMGQDAKAGAIRGATDAAVDKTMGGDPSSAKNRYAKAAAAGAAKGAATGGAPGAAAGAAKEAGKEAAGDALGGAKNLTGLDSADDEKKSGKDSGGKDKKSDAGEDGRTLGAGGTGYVTEPDDPEGPGRRGADGKKRPSLAKRAAIAGGGAATGPAALFLIFLMALMAFLKTLFFNILALLMALVKMILAMIKALIMWVVSVVFAPVIALGSLISSIGGAIFGSGSIAASGAAAMLMASSMTVLSLGVAVGGISSAVIEGLGSESTTQSNQTGVCKISDVGDGGGSSTPVSATQEANAKAVYSVFKKWGMSDQNIAGILGNWTQESGVDPTSVQGVFNEPYTYGPTKRAKIEGGTTLGIGFGQWTGARNTMLQKYAKAKGRDWYDPGLQLAFIADPKGDTAGDVAVFRSMIKNPQSSPSEAARYFHANWERSADGGAAIAQRADNAEAWYAKMSGWEVGDDSGVDDIVGDINDGSSDVVNADLNPSADCGKDGGAGNVSLTSGGMNQEQAQALISLYNKEGDKFLDDRYGPHGGPGSCGENHAMNCVSFSTYFLNKYTTFQQYQGGNGIDTAGNVAKLTGKKLSSTPTPYSVGSGPGSGPAGHTLVVLGVEGEKVIVGEAGYCSNMGRVRVTTVSALQSAGWKFVDMSDSLGDKGSGPVELPPSKGGKTTSDSDNDIVKAAASMEGKPYVWGGGGTFGPGTGKEPEDKGEVGFDCSGLTSYAYYKATGKTLPRTADMQKAQGKVIPKSEAKPGDIVWWPGHVAIYAGNDTVIHAANQKVNKVVESGLWGSPTFVRM